MNARSLYPVLVLLGCIGFDQLTFAALVNEQFVPCRPGAKVRYVNGIGATSEQEIRDSATLLSSTITHFSVTCVAEVSYLYNPSEGALIDVLGESARQKVSEFGVSFSEAVLNVGLSMYGMPALLLSPLQQADVREQFIAFLQRVSLRAYTYTVDGKTYRTVDLIDQFRDRVMIDLSQGTKVVLVAHSQGNFFANETKIAVDGVATANVQRGISIVNVANVSSFAPSNLYISAHQDKVVADVRWAGGLPMPTNYDATGACSVDEWCHGFNYVYLSTDLPTGTNEPNSMAGGLMSLLQTALSTTPNPSGSIVGSTFSSLVRIDLSSRTAQILGSFTDTAGGLTPVYDIAINPRGGPAMAISFSAISSFDPAIRSLSRLPQSNLGGNALTFNADGELFAMSGSSFYKINPTTGMVDGLPLSLGSSYATSGDLTFDSDGNLFGTVTGPSGRDYLAKIDTLRRTVTIVGDTGYYGLWGLYFSGGLLYGAASDGTLITINRTTGQGTFVAVLNIGGISGLQ